MPRDSVPDHLTQCPLEPVDCVFSWAGCNDKPLRKDVDKHTADTKHMTLLAVACGQLKKENEQIKEEMKKEIEKLKEENEKIKVINAQTVSRLKVINYDSHPILPVTVNKRGDVVHFYTELGGHHMSAAFLEPRLYLAFHVGKFDKLRAFSQPKILFKYDGDQHAQPVQTKSYRKVYNNILTQAVMKLSKRQDDGLTSIHIVNVTSIEITLTSSNEVTVIGYDPFSAAD
uniref:TRAF-type domain-containing protein n=1 Tax=Amphimedon queenslandica TaxID=400682 RepID=A0A1X7T864_AMPQE